MAHPVSTHLDDAEFDAFMMRLARLADAGDPQNPYQFLKRLICRELNIDYQPKVKKKELKEFVKSLAQYRERLAAERAGRKMKGLASETRDRVADGQEAVRAEPPSVSAANAPGPRFPANTEPAAGEDDLPPEPAIAASGEQETDAPVPASRPFRSSSEDRIRRMMRK